MHKAEDGREEGGRWKRRDGRSIKGVNWERRGERWERRGGRWERPLSSPHFYSDSCTL